MFSRIIDEINRALDNKCYLAALALSLTLPDICGQVEFPNLSSGCRYKKWYDEHLGYYYAQIGSSDNLGLSDHPYASGELVYQLRCAILHQGNSEIDIDRIKDERNKLTQFSLFIPDIGKDDDASSTESEIIYDDNGEISNRAYSINVIYLCEILSNCAKAYYSKNKEKFNIYNFKVFDSL